jgi:mono/diheme cytochrome c family protein
MRERLLFTVFVWGAPFVLALAPLLWRSAEAAGEYDRGKSLYENKCQLCHGANGKGDGPAASAFSPSPGNFTDRTFWQGDPEKKIAESIRKGKGSMPAFTLSPEEIEEIIDFLSHTFKRS